MKRYALVRNVSWRGDNATVEEHQQTLEAYLPGNYRVLAAVIEEEKAFSSTAPGGSVVERRKLAFVIEGEDSAGWTLDSYVIPRLGSGLIFADEIDLSHPVMKVIPA